MGFLKKLWKSSAETPFNVESLNDLESRINSGIEASTQNHLYQGVELTDFTWKQLSDKAKAGDFSGLNIGDYKSFMLGSEVIRMQIAGMDTHYGTGEEDYFDTGDTLIGHHIDFISKDCLKATYKMRNSNSNNGTSGSAMNPWHASELYTTLNTTIYNQLPTEIKDLIVTKKTLLEKRYKSASGALTSSYSDTWSEDAGKLWLPSEYEVFGSITQGTKPWSGQQLIQYPIFAHNYLNRIKGQGDGGEPTKWWLSTAFDGDSYSYCCVHNGGYCDWYDAQYEQSRVPICFRFA